MQTLAFMDRIWRGPASSILLSDEKHVITQTERVGPFLGGSVKLIEGRGYEADGKVSFNAFGTISFNPANSNFTLHSYATGQVGELALTPKSQWFYLAILTTMLVSLQKQPCAITAPFATNCFLPGKSKGNSHRLPHTPDIAQWWLTKQARVFTAELGCAFIAYPDGGAAGVDVFDQHDLAGVLQAQVF